MEGKNEWHGKAISDKEFELAMKELGGESNG
jgi:transketolase